MVYRGSGVAYDERTGFKTKGRKLRRDYYTGAWTEDPDGPHPQDFIVPPGADGINQRFGPPPAHAINGCAYIGRDYMDVSTMERITFRHMAFGYFGMRAGGDSDTLPIGSFDLTIVTSNIVWGGGEGLTGVDMLFSGSVLDGGYDPDGLAQVSMAIAAGAMGADGGGAGLSQEPLTATQGDLAAGGGDGNLTQSSLVVTDGGGNVGGVTDHGVGEEVGIGEGSWGGVQNDVVYPF